MPWSKKADAPDYVNLAQAAASVITGTTDAWMLQWWELVDSRVVDVQNTLCAPGPEECAAFDATDFLGFIGRPGPLTSLSAIGLVPKLNCFARNRLFEALCEFTVGAGETAPLSCTLVEDNAAIDGVRPGIFGFVPIGVPYTTARVTQLSGFGVASGIHFSGFNNGNWWGDLSGVETPAGSHVWLVNIAYPQINQLDVWLDTNGGTWRLELCSAMTDGSPAPHDDIARPPSAVDPPAGEYPDLVAVGRELDRQERKLDWLLAASVDKQIADVGQLVADGAAVAVDNGVQVVLSADNIGVSVAVTSVGAGTDMSFGNPPRYYHLGRVIFGNQYGWLPPVDLAVSPMLIYPLPPGVDRLRVHVNGDSTASVQRLSLGEPLG